MKEKFDDLISEVVRSVTERLLEEQYPLGTKNVFTHDPSVQLQIINALIDQLETRSAYAEAASELLASETERAVFEKVVGERAYKALYDAHGGVA
jgi:hypothetical protein